MRTKKSIFCVFCLTEITGLVVLFMNWKIGISIVIVGVILQMFCVSKMSSHKSELKNCPKCKSSIPIKVRICPECGYSYRNGIREEDLLELIEQEKDEVENMTSEEIDCNFEKIEEIAVDEITSFDGDIEAFLEEKERKGEALGVE